MMSRILPLAALALLGALLWTCTTPGLPPARAPLREADGVAAYYAGDLPAAAAAYRAVLERQPGDLAAGRNLAQVLRESGRPLEALRELEALLAGRLEDSPLRLEAARTALFAGRPERALAWLQGAASPSARGLYLRALALQDLGRLPDAAGALGSSLKQESYNPMGWYWLGGLHFQMGALEQAEMELLQALSQDRNLTGAFLPLSRIYAATGRTKKAYALLGRARESLPGNREVTALLEELLEAHPELAAGVEAEKRRRREVSAPQQAESFPDHRESLPAVRVGLAEKVRELYLKTGGAFALEGWHGGGENGGAGSSAGEAGTVLLARMAEDSVEVVDSAGAVIARSPEGLRLSYPDPRDTTILFDVAFGQGSFWAGSEDRMYRGAIELVPHPEGLTVIDSLSIEEYLYSVLPSEMPSYWPEAALQAQAVAARSYTLANLGRFAPRGFDLLGTVASAAYRGLGGESPAARAAVDATRGLVLMQPGGGEKPLPAFYSANSGGYTETTEYVWGFTSSLPAVPDLLLPAREDPLPPAELACWLASRPVTFSSHPRFASRSAYRWTLWVPREEIEARLGRGDRLGTVLSIRAARRGVSGRIPEVRVRGTAGEEVVKWDAIRSRLGGLRSNLFVVEPKLGRDGLPEYFVFTGAGWGHGVGMCQTGAAGMASVGFSARAILAHYYGGVRLEQLY